MFKKYISVFLIVASVLLVMTSCGKKDNTETTTNPETQDNQIIIDEGTTEESSENASTEDAKPNDGKNDSDNTTKPSGSQSTAKPDNSNSTTKPSTTNPTTTKPTTTKPTTTRPTTTQKNEAGICSICGGILTNDDGKLSVGNYCDGRCDEWNNL